MTGDGFAPFDAVKHEIPHFRKPLKIFSVEALFWETENRLVTAEFRSSGSTKL
jgi:hypothetical protein